MNGNIVDVTTNNNIPSSILLWLPSVTPQSMYNTTHEHNHKKNEMNYAMEMIHSWFVNIDVVLFCFVVDVCWLDQYTVSIVDDIHTHSCINTDIHRKYVTRMVVWSYRYVYKYGYGYMLDVDGYHCIICCFHLLVVVVIIYHSSHLLSSNMLFICIDGCAYAYT